MLIAGLDEEAHPVRKYWPLIARQSLPFLLADRLLMSEHSIGRTTAAEVLTKAAGAAYAGSYLV